jgi:hypothetical protein
LPSGDSPTLRDLVNNLMSQGTYNNMPLTNLGFWNVIESNGQYQGEAASISNEAYELFTDSGAYDTIPSNWNAASATADMVADFASNPQYYALTDGYSSLPDTLAQQLTAAGVQIMTNTQVTAVAQVGGVYAITVAGHALPITADNVILAVPPRALELIVSPELLAIQNELQQSSPIPLFKIFLVYTSDWWSNVVEGWEQYTRMTTDLPMRQIYNFGTTTVNGTTYWLLQASYSDGLKAGYWSGLLANEPGQTIDTSIFGDVSATPGNQGSGIARWLADDGTTLSQHPLFNAVHQQFITLVNAIGSGATPAEPIAGMAIDWATDPFGGGVNFWNVGVDLNSAYPAILNPVPMSGQLPGETGLGGLFIVGEGYSLMQGWVEGALWSVEDAMQRAWGPAWGQPSWLSTTPLGPST